MKQIIPPDELLGLPCSNVAISCALGHKVTIPTSHSNGYMTLKDNNKAVRKYLDVKKYVYFKKGERPLLKELKLDKALVCVYGHLVYLESDSYHSFFDNENDEVVAYWLLK